MPEQQSPDPSRQTHRRVAFDVYSHRGIHTLAEQIDRRTSVRVHAFRGLNVKGAFEIADLPDDAEARQMQVLQKRHGRLSCLWHQRPSRLVPNFRRMNKLYSQELLHKALLWWQSDGIPWPRKCRPRVQFPWSWCLENLFQRRVPLPRRRFGDDVLRQPFASLYRLNYSPLLLFVYSIHQTLRSKVSTYLPSEEQACQAKLFMPQPRKENCTDYDLAASRLYFFTTRLKP